MFVITTLIAVEFAMTVGITTNTTTSVQIKEISLTDSFSSTLTSSPDYTPYPDALTTSNNTVAGAVSPLLRNTASNQLDLEERTPLHQNSTAIWSSSLSPSSSWKTIERLLTTVYPDATLMIMYSSASRNESVLNTVNDPPSNG